MTRVEIFEENYREDYEKDNSFLDRDSKGFFYNDELQYAFESLLISDLRRRSKRECDLIYCQQEAKTLLKLLDELIELEDNDWKATSDKNKLPVDGQLCLFYSNKMFAGTREERFEKMVYKNSWEDDIEEYYSYWKPILSPKDNSHE